MRVKIIPFLVCSIFLAACSPTDFFLGKDNRPEPRELPQIAEQVQTQILWRDSLGAGSETGAIALLPDGDDSAVFAVSTDGIVAGYDIHSGSRRFTRDLGKDITAGIRYAGNLLLLGTRNGELLALNSSDGKTAWRVSLNAPILARPAVSGNMAVVRSENGGVYAYNLNDGQLIWQYRINEPDLSVRGYSEPVIGGGVVIVATDSGRFIILDQASGLPVAGQRVAVGQGHNDIQRLVDIDATPKINQGIMFGSAYQGNTFAVDLQNGAPLWAQPQATTAQDFALSPDALFLHDGIDHFYALDQRSGAILWKNDALEGRYLSPVVALPGKVGSVDKEGYLHWLDINDGHLIGQTRIGDSNAPGAPFIGRQTIIWQLADGDIVAVQPQ